MQCITHKITQGLMIAGILILLAIPSFANSTRLTDQEMKEFTGQSGISTLLDDELTEEERREAEKNNRQTQDLMALSALIPSQLLRDLQYVRYTVNDAALPAREFNTIQRDVLTVPPAVGPIITLPAIGLGGVGGFF